MAEVSAECGFRLLPHHFPSPHLGQAKRDYGYIWLYAPEQIMKALRYSVRRSALFSLRIGFALLSSGKVRALF